MAQPHEKIARSLERLRELQDDGRRIFRSREFSRTHRERLLEGGFLRQIIQGWLMSSSPDVAPGDTTQWYASYWEFVARYCVDRFEDRWHLSPRQSLLLAAEDTTIPPQMVVHSPDAGNNKRELLFATSLFLLRDRPAAPPGDIVSREGLRLLKPEAAIVAVPPNFFTRHPVEAQVVLTQLTDVSGLLRRLLDGGHSVIAGRLAGALRRIGHDKRADEILRTMDDAGFDVRRESDPFDSHLRTIQPSSAGSPIVDRLRALWESTRETVVDELPAAPGLPEDPDSYLESVEGLYKRDAYHSLSIEGYQVTPELIDRARSGDWDSAESPEDESRRDALAARGYWEAFQKVTATITRILEGEPAASLVREDHGQWYRDLFGPFVRAGLPPASTLAGYRSDPVFVRGSRHVPPRAQAVPDAMSALFDLLEEEPETAVRAVLGHWLLGYVHPYPDGNGRMARFLMNTMFASGGYPWTVIRVDDRGDYMAALDAASVDRDLQPFSRFLGERLQWSWQQMDAENA